MKTDKIILGIDPGTTIMGYGIIHIKDNKMEFIDIGGKTILLIHVDKIDRSDPCHANGKVYRRVNTQDKEVKSDELVSFIKGEL